VTALPGLLNDYQLIIKSITLFIYHVRHIRVKRKISQISEISAEKVVEKINYYFICDLKYSHFYEHEDGLIDVDDMMKVFVEMLLCIQIILPFTKYCLLSHTFQGRG
jgi:hypothetical protein